MLYLSIRLCLNKRIKEKAKNKARGKREGIMKGEGKVNRMNKRECYLKAIEFSNPDYIPCCIQISDATWCKYKGGLKNIVKRHPFIFWLNNKEKNYCKFLPHQRKGYFTDPWGCVWHIASEGMAGNIVNSPLEKWDDLEKLKVPDITQADWGAQLDWQKIKQNTEKIRQGDGLVRGELTHGFMFQRIYYLRGFENSMVDLTANNSMLKHLIGIVLNRNIRLIHKWLEVKPDIMWFGDDLGMQGSLMISPELWRRYIKPCYKKMFSVIKKNGAYIYFHTDGYILEIIPDLIECGISILNLQDKVNGIDEIVKLCKGKVCIEIDLDRQKILPYGSFKDIEDHVREVIMKLGSKKGGLTLSAGIYPDVPLNNIEMLCQLMEKYSTYYS